MLSLWIVSVDADRRKTTAFNYSDFCLIEDAVERRGRNRISFLNLCESEEEEQEEGETYWHSCQPCRAARFAVTWNEAKLPGSW